MKGAVKVVDKAEYDEWYKAEKEKKNAAGEKAAAAAATAGAANA